MSRKRIPAVYHLLTYSSPLLAPLLPSLYVHTIASVLEEGHGCYSRRKFIRKLPTFLTIRLTVVCLWLHSSRLQVTALPRPRLSFSQKRNKAFPAPPPQKKVPEPISHLALSRLFGLTTTRLTSKAHLCTSPRVLRTQNQQVYHLILRSNGPLSSSGTQPCP